MKNFLNAEAQRRRGAERKNLLSSSAPLRLCVSAFKNFLFLIMVTLTSSCGYQIGQGALDGYETISLSCVDGDGTGGLSRALIHAIGTSSPFTYTRCGGDLCLEVKLCDQTSLPIGFRQDPYSEEPPPKDIIPSEQRLTIIALVTLTDRCSNCVLLDGEPVSASVEFDHDYYSSLKSTNLFSLDQLTDLGQAQDTARRSLFKELAKQIVDRVNNSN